MKRKLFSILIVFITSIAIAACTDENIKPQDGGGNGSDDQCQWGCK